MSIRNQKYRVSREECEILKGAGIKNKTKPIAKTPRSNLNKTIASNRFIKKYNQKTY